MTERERELRKALQEARYMYYTASSSTGRRIAAREAFNLGVELHFLLEQDLFKAESFDFFE
ncbi:hypothetical protein CPT_Slocum_131 [Serratia phage Slocum]|nr:hypothetical protein CPT_Slocum_131 [Serratia phage Slocum]URC22580.1 hypothetical protein KAMAJI_01520 [Serratia phage vB_SmaM-Kamaji]